MYEKYRDYQNYNVEVQSIPKVVTDSIQKLEYKRKLLEVLLVSKGSAPSLYVMHTIDVSNEYFELVSFGEKPIKTLFNGVNTELEFNSLKSKLNRLIGRIVGEYEIDGVTKILCTEDDLSPITDVETFIESISKKAP